MQHCPLRGPPKCPPASKRYRTHDGTCNNLNRPRWGSTMTPVQRFLSPSYSDDLQAPRRSIFGTQLPSAREISSVVHESEHVENPGITHLLMQWGQFIDHDITSTSQSRGFNGSVPRCCNDGGRDFIPKELLHPECYPIPVPQTDPFYGPRGVRCLDFVRSSPAPRDDCALGWREQLNQVTAYIDGSPIYASSARQSDKLRLFRNGMLQYGRVQQRRPILPPERRDDLCRGGAVSTDCFKSGDGRVNEHPGLVAAHIVWLRQHNRMAQELAHLNPNWSDEKLYQETRKIVGAMIQHITYREWLPIVLGSEVMRLFELELIKKGFYEGYSVKVNSSPSSSFGSAAFRFGHSLVQPTMIRYDRFHRPMRNNVSLHDELTNPSNIWSMGAVDRLLLGMVNQPIQNRDEFVTDELTNHLFQTPQFDFGMDLAAINIQRGRDHGVPPYTSWREPCGLSALLEFEDLFRVMPARAVKKLKTLYRHVDDIDLFTGGMAERPVLGGLVGPTFACIIAQQFSNLRKGDRFWYENGNFDSSFTPAQLQQIRRISFAQVLCRTLDTIDSIQPFVFLSPDNPDNDRISCKNGLLNNFDLSPWVEIENNDIRISEDEISAEKPKRKTTTAKPTTKKPTKGSSKLSQKKPQNVTRNVMDDDEIEFKMTDFLDKTIDNTTLTNKTLTADNDTTKKTANKNVTKAKPVKIDDKLDFKNKSKRFDDITFSDRINSRQNSKSKYDEYDYDDDEDDAQSVQSLVINNLQKRPYHGHSNHRRPVITVTENIDKYTYLINYVPKPTVSWRQTTRRQITRRPEKDVVKVTYQNYADTYRRPNPYYYTQRDNTNDKYRYDSPLTTNLHSSARSNDQQTTLKTKQTDFEKTDGTTENLYKLITFGYVGNYRGDTPDKTNDKLKLDSESNNNDKNEVKRDAISKEFVTFDNTETKDKLENVKLSTFYLYETATKPFLNSQRPTRRNDEDIPIKKTNSKYYYVKNVLHKYPDDSDAPKPIAQISEAKGNNKKTQETNKGTENTNHNINGRYDSNVEERSANAKLNLGDVEGKSTINQSASKLRANIKKPASTAKTPSVAFQVIPSESSPTQWAVYEEKADLPETLPFRTPTIQGDPYALKEIPRPMNFGLRKRRPGRS